jgi:hypothetical protein
MPAANLCDGSSEARATIGGVPVDINDHLCVLYRGRAERDRLLLPFLREGLRQSQTCMCVVNDGEEQQVHSALTYDEDAQLDDEPLEVTGPAGAHLRTGSFAPGPMLEFLYGWSKTKFDQQHRPVARIAADMTWAMPLVSGPFVAELADYEARATRWVRAYPQICLCLYDMDCFGGDVVLAVIRSHPKVWVSGVVLENPYFSYPGETVSTS